MNPTSSLAADARSLDALRSQAGHDPRKAIQAAASQFEALFMRQLLKSMRDAMPKSGMWDSANQGLYQDMFDQQLAQTMSGRPGGLADVIARQLSRHMNRSDSRPDTAASAPSGTVPAAAPDMDVSPGARAVQAARFAAARAAAARSGIDGGDPVPGTSASANEQGGAAARRLGPAASDRIEPSRMPEVDRLAPAQAGFVQRMWPHALLAEKTTGVPAAYIVGQAALESGWGSREIRNPDGSPSHNLFGIKAGANWSGDAVQAKTTEYVEGRARKQVEQFRAYGSYSEAFSDWAKLLANSPRYGEVLRSADSAGQFADGMQRAGYATDPQYGAKLERTINRALALKRLVL